MFNKSLSAKISKQPSTYPSTLFHLVRISQFFSAAIVLSILSFFVHFLSIERYYVPWTFLLLLTVSVCTILALIVTTARHHLRLLSLKVNLALNGFNTILWALGFALLIWNTRSTLSHGCTRATWHSEGGVMICRLYKALATFTITGFVSTVLSLVLDIRTRRGSHEQGTYNSMQDVKITHSNASLQGLVYPQPEHSSGRSLSHETLRPYSVQRPMEAQQFGYSMPSEQTTYDSPSGSHWL